MNVLFVLGAGASCDVAKTPLGKGLGWYYYNDTRDFHTQTRKQEEFLQFLEVAKKLYPHSNFDKVIEKFKSSLQEIYHDVIPYLPEKRHYVDEMLRVVQEEGDLESAAILRKIIYKHVVGAGFVCGSHAYDDFLQKIVAMNQQGENVSIISLNFDTYIHEDHHSFDKSFLFDYNIDFDYFDRNRKVWYRKEAELIISFLKLNGSFDWALCRECRKLSLLHWHRREEDYDKLKCLNSTCSNLVEPLICMPHDQPDKRFAILRNLAAQEIQKADHIIVIGYSFPVYDKHVISLFRENLREETSILIVDKDLNDGPLTRQKEKVKIENKYLNFFPHLSKANLEICLDGFKDYLKSNSVV